METLIVCAAIKLSDDSIICGVRHHDQIMNRELTCRFDAQTIKVKEQGFVDNRGNFLSRKEAKIIAELNGQIRRRVGGESEELFSENLY